MRTVLLLMAAWVLSGVAGQAAPADVHWQERPFFPRRANQKVPPPQFYAPTAEVPAGAVVTIKVVESPKGAALVLHDFLGGPVFSRGIVKEFSHLSAGQVLTWKVDKAMKVGLTTRAGEGEVKEPGTCAGLEKKEGGDVMKYTFGDRGKMVLEVEVHEEGSRE